MLLKKIRWTLKRHPFLYITRFRLLSRNSNKEAISFMSYNDWNKKEDIPSYFYTINNEIFPEGRPVSDLDTAKYLSAWLLKNTKAGSGLSEPSDKALEIMLHGSGGVCSDVVQIYNNFCVINNLKVREWGTTSAPFKRGNGGHSFNEVYVKELKKWVLIDSSWGMMFFGDEEIPLSVLEFFALSRINEKVNSYFFIDNKVTAREVVVKHYLNTDITPFLIYKYRNKTYDWFLKLARPYVPVFIIHFFVFILGRSYNYQFPIDDYRKIFS